MSIKEMLIKNRTCRRFDRNAVVSYKEFFSLVELARLSAAAANNQPLRYLFAVGEHAKNVFDCIKWAGFYKDGAPAAEQRPNAYIVILNQVEQGKADLISVGIAAQSILLGAAEMGYRCCLFGSVDRKELLRRLNIGVEYEILNVIAIGKSAETAVIDDIKAGGCTRYWRDKDGVHHVPKIIAADLVVTPDNGKTV